MIFQTVGVFLAYSTSTEPWTWFRVGWSPVVLHYGEQPCPELSSGLTQLEGNDVVYMADIPCNTRVYLEYPEVGLPVLFFQCQRFHSHWNSGRVAEQTLFRRMFLTRCQRVGRAWWIPGYRLERVASSHCDGASGYVIFASPQVKTCSQGSNAHLKRFGRDLEDHHAKKEPWTWFRALKRLQSWFTRNILTVFVLVSWNKFRMTLLQVTKEANLT